MHSLGAELIKDRCIDMKSMQRLYDEVRHAFSCEVSSMTEISDEEELLRIFAAGISRRRLSSPAILFLETFQPLSFIGNQAMIFFRPFVSMVFPAHKYDSVSRVLAKRSNIRKLISLLEEAERQ